jgi:hypothetical protein
MSDRLSLVNFMFALAEDIAPSMNGLDPDAQLFIDQAMTQALCAANKGNAVTVKTLAAQVRWRISHERACCEG